MKVLVINGPNLNLLGRREPEKYGCETLEDIEKRIAAEAEELGVECSFFQSNSEGALIDALQQTNAEGIICNAGAYSHYSIALRDAIAAIAAPVIEVHMTNIYAREEFRQHSVLSAVCRGCIAGLGAQGYLLALRALAGNAPKL